MAPLAAALDTAIFSNGTGQGSPPATARARRAAQGHARRSSAIGAASRARVAGSCSRRPARARPPGSASCGPSRRATRRAAGCRAAAPCGTPCSGCALPLPWRRLSLRLLEMSAPRGREAVLPGLTPRSGMSPRLRRRERGGGLPVERGHSLVYASGVRTFRRSGAWASGLTSLELLEAAELGALALRVGGAPGVRRRARAGSVPAGYRAPASRLARTPSRPWRRRPSRTRLDPSRGAWRRAAGRGDRRLGVRLRARRLAALHQLEDALQPGRMWSGEIAISASKSSIAPSGPSVVRSTPRA